MKLTQFTEHSQRLLQKKLRKQRLELVISQKQQKALKNRRLMQRKLRKQRLELMISQRQQKVLTSDQKTKIVISQRQKKLMTLPKLMIKRKQKKWLLETMRNHQKNKRKGGSLAAFSDHQKVKMKRLKINLLKIILQLQKIPPQTRWDFFCFAN